MEECSLITGWSGRASAWIAPRTQRSRTFSRSGSRKPGMACWTWTRSFTPGAASRRDSSCPHSLSVANCLSRNRRPEHRVLRAARTHRLRTVRSPEGGLCHNRPDLGDVLRGRRSRSLPTDPQQRLHPAYGRRRSSWSASLLLLDHGRCAPRATVANRLRLLPAGGDFRRPAGGNVRGSRRPHPSAIMAAAPWRH